MATSTQESQANIQSFLSAGGTQEILAKEKYGSTLSSGELQKFIGKYGLKPSGVYSAQNLAGTSSQPTDLLGIRQQVYSDLGVNTAQEEFNKAYKDYQDFQTTLDTQQNYLEAQPVSLNVIRGEQAEAQRLGAQTSSAKARGLDVLQRSLESKLGEAQVQYGIRAQELTDKRNLQVQYAGAGIKLSDSYEEAAKKIGKYQKKQATESVFAQVFGYIPSKMSTKEMESKLKKNYKAKKKLSDELERIDLETKQIALGKLKREDSTGAGNYAAAFGDVGSSIGGTATYAIRDDGRLSPTNAAAQMQNLASILGIKY